MTRRAMPLLFVLAASVLALSACGGGSSSSSTTPATTGGGGGGGGSSTVKISADPSGALKYEQTDVSATAGSITIDFTNMSSLPHDVTIEGDGGGPTRSRARPRARPSISSRGPTRSSARSTATALPAWRARSPSTSLAPVLIDLQHLGRSRVIASYLLAGDEPALVDCGPTILPRRARRGPRRAGARGRRPPPSRAHAHPPGPRRGSRRSRPQESRAPGARERDRSAAPRRPFPPRCKRPPSVRGRLRPALGRARPRPGGERSRRRERGARPRGVADSRARLAPCLLPRGGWNVLLGGRHGSGHRALDPHRARLPAARHRPRGLGALARLDRRAEAGAALPAAFRRRGGADRARRGDTRAAAHLGRAGARRNERGGVRPNGRGRSWKRRAIPRPPRPTRRRGRSGSPTPASCATSPRRGKPRPDKPTTV